MSLLYDSKNDVFLPLFEAYRKQTVRDLFAFTPTKLQPDVARLWLSILPLVRQSLRNHPQQSIDLLTYPTLSVWIHCAKAEQDQPKGMLNTFVAQLCGQWLCQASYAGLLPPTGVYFPLATDRFLCPETNTAFVCTQASQGARFENRRILLDIPGQPQPILVNLDPPTSTPAGAIRISPGYVPITPRLKLALVDNNPLWAQEAHPEKDGNALDLGNHTPQQWVNSLTETLALIQQTLPGIATEMDAMLRLIIPCGFDDQRHLSASYKEAVGLVYMTLHPRLLTLVEALIHEFQHNKLNAVTYLDPLLHNAFEPLYPSPVRPDLRPLHGVLLAAHAFLPVAELYLQLIRQGHPLSQTGGFDQRLRQIVASNTEACQTLQAADPTKLGRVLLDEMWEKNEEHRRYIEQMP